tara:strand:- start:4455 stop:5393 length:939 start_codon:yes stop_codon:yes gene_type:complete
VRITNSKSGSHEFTNRITLDGSIVVNNTSTETDSKVTDYTFTKSAGTQEMDMIGNVAAPITMNWEFEGVEPSSTKSWRDTTLEIFKNGASVVGPLTFNSGNATGSGTFSAAAGDVITQSVVTDNNPSNYPQFVDVEQYKGSVSGGLSLLDNSAGYIAANGNRTDTLTSLTLSASPTDPKLKYKVLCSAAQTSTITVDIEDTEDGAQPQFLSVTQTSTADTFFEQPSDPTSNGTYTQYYFTEGETYELEMSYKKLGPGENDTIFQSATGAGSSLVSDTDTGTAQSLIGPINTTFTPTNVASGPVVIGFSQTSP